MNIIGFNSVIIDSAVSLIQAGIPTACLEEERYTRIKHDGSFPTKSLKKVLELGNIRAEDINAICCSFEEWRAIKHRISSMLFSKKIFSIPKAISYRSKEFFKIMGMKEEISKTLNFNGNIKIKKYNHHICHAASTFFVSPFDTSAILVMDSTGEDTAVSYYTGEGNKIKKIKQLPFAQSLGAFYTSLTEYLGFKPNSGEGKVMGLAAYGEPEYYKDFSRMVKVLENGQISMDLSYFTHHLGEGVHCSKKFIDRYGSARKPESDIENKHKNIAASLQKVLEDAGIEIAKYLRRTTGMKNLCISGGVGLNSVMNGRIVEESGFDDIYLIPSPSDSGTSLGAALYHYHQILGKERKYVLESPFLGEEYSDSNIDETIKKYDNLNSEIRPDYISTVARLISEGNIVAWYQGKFEFGPRALGHRSILADPRNPKMKDILNARVKFRESFRPFAPAVLYEKRDKVFTNNQKNPFMLFVFKIKEDMRKIIPSVNHIDNTGRGQTVSKDTCPLFWQLIDEFDKQTGVPVILNTSFNVRGEPIINTPCEAVECYIKTDMDYLCLGNRIIWKKDRPRP